VILIDTRPTLTSIDLANELVNIGYQIRHNVLTNDIEVIGLEKYQEDAAAILPTKLFEFLGDTYKKASKQNIVDYLAVLARDNAVNPPLDLITAKPWDKKDHFPDIYRALHIPDDDALSKALIRKWFMQGVSLLHNEYSNPFGADGVLILIGPQGAGKTSFFRKASMKDVHLFGMYFRDGQEIDDRDKDKRRRAVTTWIAELGEIGSTMKSDIDSLKAFITSEYDEYRLPYGRTDKKAPRRTNLCGTANDSADDAGYLIDPSGNRRFWTIHVKEISLELVNAIDFLQVWRQAYHFMKKEGLHAFRLTKEEQELLEARNAGHMKKTKGMQEVDDILFAAISEPDKHTWTYQTTTKWKMQYDAIKNFDSGIIGRAITAAIKNNPEYAVDGQLNEKRKRQDGKTERVRCLPSYKPNQYIPPGFRQED